MKKGIVRTIVLLLIIALFILTGIPIKRGFQYEYDRTDGEIWKIIV